MYRIKHNLAVPASGLYGVLDDNNCIGGLRIIPMLLSVTSLLGKATVDLISMVENHNKFNPFSLVDLQQIQDQLADMTLLIAETYLVIEKRKLEMV